MDSMVDAVKAANLHEILGVFMIGCILYWVLFYGDRLHSGIPTAGVDPTAWFKAASARTAFMLDGKGVIQKGLEDYPSVFQVVTGTGTKIVLPNRFVEDIKNNPQLSLVDAIHKEFFASYYAFRPYAASKTAFVMTEVVRTKLSNSLGITVLMAGRRIFADGVSEMIGDLADETNCALEDIFGSSTEWQTRNLKAEVLHLIARLSSRVFLGQDMARSEQWLDISKSYTIDSFIAIRMMRQWPAALRSLVYWLSPKCKRVREQVSTSGQLIWPLVEGHRQRKRKALEAGLPAPDGQDTISWMDELADGVDCDVPCGQLILSVVALHTTTELLTQALFDLCHHPELTQPLREEVISVVGDKPLTKAVLFKLRLMDSFLKESQRLHIGDITTMQRFAHAKVVLSDGSTIPRGAKVVTTMEMMMDPTIYPNPEIFDAYRFLKMRESAGQENRWQFVSTCSEHMGFGNGQHACPGRFFAANETKVALCHLLLKYDWKFPDNAQKDGTDVTFGTEFESSLEAKVLLRRRKEEITFKL
ncbi:hypothetical protein N7449_008980 [Penicillium cf. viridicatum]|uniref:Uncharacterized protein n=1 Tax=Penicillium cf. viridicatum TaxID=2972119 RepID=A0A9W9J993_9EURO|nr:hypothetical protein N7449_008980 [Penicillium cf. viridicatum]